MSDLNMSINNINVINDLPSNIKNRYYIGNNILNTLNIKPLQKTVKKVFYIKKTSKIPKHIKNQKCN